MSNIATATSPRRLSGNALKVIAATTMVVDHIGVVFFPYMALFRIIGRLAFPIFAFMIAEGCHYTKNRLRYFLGIFLLGAVCQTVYFAVSGDTHMNILLNFSCSIVLIYLLQEWKARQSFVVMLPFAAAVAAAYVLNQYVQLDYGFFGLMVPVLVAVAYPARREPISELQHILRVLALAIALIPSVLEAPALRWYCFFTIPLLLLYSGKRGKKNFKYGFYLFYPLHLAVLQIIAWCIAA